MGLGQNMAFSLSEAIVCVIGLSKCFISRAQSGCVKFAAQALLNWQWKKSILFETSGSGAFGVSTICTLLPCISYLNERSPLMWISLGPQS